MADRGGDVLQVVHRELGVHGQGEAAFGQAFGAGESALSIAERRQSRLAVKRDGVVNAGLDAVR